MQEDMADTARGKVKSLPTVPKAEDGLDLRFVPLEDIEIDQAYQRRISRGGMSRIMKIISGFDWSRFGALTLSEGDDGRLYVVDGQHRMVAARALRITIVPAVITRNTQAGQASDFVAINTVRTTVASIDSFRARVASGDATAKTVQQMLDQLNISTDVPAGASIGPRETRAVSLLEKMLNRHEQGIVFTALEMMIDAQPHQKNLLTAFAIGVTVPVVAKMIAAGRDLDRLATILEETDFDTLKEEAAQLVKLTGGQTQGRGTELLLQKVNKGLRERLG